MTPEPELPADGNHALLIGNVAGAILRGLCGADGQAVSPTEVELVNDDQGNHTDTIRIARPSGTYLVKITKEPD